MKSVLVAFIIVYIIAAIYLILIEKNKFNSKK